MRLAQHGSKYRLGWYRTDKHTINVKEEWEDGKDMINNFTQTTAIIEEEPR